jgi:hypothetical protein
VQTASLSSGRAHRSAIARRDTLLRPPVRFACARSGDTRVAEPRTPAPSGAPWCCSSARIGTAPGRWTGRKPHRTPGPTMRHSRSPTRSRPSTPMCAFRWGPIRIELSTASASAGSRTLAHGATPSTSSRCPRRPACTSCATRAPLKTHRAACVRPAGPIGESDQTRTPQRHDGSARQAIACSRGALRAHRPRTERVALRSAAVAILDSHTSKCVRLVRAIAQSPSA